MILKLLGETVCKAREPAHVHSHGEVLTLHVARANGSGIGIPSNWNYLDSDALKVSPAMAAGVTNRLWEIEDLLALLD